MVSDNRLIINDSGNVGLGNPCPSYKLRVYGFCYADRMKKIKIIIRSIRLNSILKKINK